MPQPVTAYIALGSNLGDRRANIESAINLIWDGGQTQVTNCSPLIETAPVGGPPNQGPFLNAACEVKTTRSPRELLDLLLGIEHELGRERRERWGPRTIDLDLLLYGDVVVDEPGLTIPHPRMHERAFVLEPLAAIAPRMVHPVLRQSIAIIQSTVASVRLSEIDLSQRDPEFADRLLRVEYYLYDWEPGIAELSPLAVHEIHGYIRLTGEGEQKYYLFHEQEGCDFVVRWRSDSPCDHNPFERVDVSTTDVWKNLIGEEFEAIYHAPLVPYQYRQVMTIATSIRSVFCCPYGEGRWSQDQLHVSHTLPPMPAME